MNESVLPVVLVVLFYSVLLVLVVTSVRTLLKSGPNSCDRWTDDSFHYIATPRVMSRCLTRGADPNASLGYRPIRGCRRTRLKSGP